MKAETPTFQIQFDINFIGDNSIAMSTPLGLKVVTTSSSDAGSGSDDEEDTGGQVDQEDVWQYYRIYSTAVSAYRCITHIASHMADHTCTLHYT